MRKIFAALIAISATSSVFASTYTGPVLAVQIQASLITPGTVRIGVQISGSTACANTAWYSAEFPDSSGSGKAWIAALLAAQARGANVTIGGTGTCDGYSVESIYYINALP